MIAKIAVIVKNTRGAMSFGNYGNFAMVSKKTEVGARPSCPQGFQANGHAVAPRKYSRWLMGFRPSHILFRGPKRSWFLFRIFNQGLLEMACSNPTATVADLLRLRRNCRHGLSGLSMRHLPTGRVFLCRGTEWSARSELMLYVTDGRYAPGREPKKDDMNMTSHLDIDITAYTPGERVPAAECVLLERWPVVCCRPSRRVGSGR